MNKNDPHGWVTRTGGVECACPTEDRAECPRKGAFGGSCDCACHAFPPDEVAEDDALFEAYDPKDKNL